MTSRVALGVGLFVGSLGVGRLLGEAGVLTDARAERLMRFVVMCVSPLVLALSFWRLDLRDPEPLLLPVVGAGVALGTLLPAWAFARWAKLTRAQQGSFLTCAMFSNVGFLGALIAFALFGELGYSLAMLYVVHFSPLFYVVGFGIARRLGQPARRVPAESFWRDALRLYPFAGLCAGLLLALARVSRPTWLSGVNQLLIPMDTGLYCLAVGSQLQVVPLHRAWRPGAAMAAIKFLFSPLIGWLIARALRLDRSLEVIVLLQASMPVATSPLILPMLFGLDRRMSSALWWTTTLLAVPWLLIYYPLIVAVQ